jgi:hypothetical protein
MAIINSPDGKLKVGDRVTFVLPNGDFAAGIVKAVLETTSGTQVNISYGKGLSVSVNIQRVLAKLFPVN